jgi:hypothetical protein
MVYVFADLVTQLASCELSNAHAVVLSRQKHATNKQQRGAPSCVLSGLTTRDENGTEIFRIDRFRFLYYEPFFNMKNCQFQLVSQPFLTIFYTL